MLGLTVSGDLGDITIYTSKRRRRVYFVKAPPLEPPSPAQQVMRSRWSQALDAWRRMSPGDRETWQRVCERAHLRINGINLWIWNQTRPDDGTIATIERIAGEKLPNTKRLS